jgi:hypothetical protein
MGPPPDGGGVQQRRGQPCGYPDGAAIERPPRGGGAKMARVSPAGRCHGPAMGHRRHDGGVAAPDGGWSVDLGATIGRREGYGGGLA